MHSEDSCVEAVEQRKIRPSKRPDVVRAYYRTYYAKNKQRIAEFRRKRRVHPDFREQIMAQRKKVYERRKRYLFSLPLEVLEELDRGEISTTIKQAFASYDGVVDVTLSPDAKVVVAGKCKWDVDDPDAPLGGYQISKQGRTLRVYGNEEVPKKRTPRGYNTPRLFCVGQKFLFLYPVGALVALTRRHRWTIEGWLSKGIIPHVRGVNGGYWVPDFVFLVIGHLQDKFSVPSRRQQGVWIKVALQQIFGRIWYNLN